MCKRDQLTSYRLYVVVLKVSLVIGPLYAGPYFEFLVQDVWNTFNNGYMLGPYKLTAHRLQPELEVLI